MPLTPADVHNVAFKKPPIGKRGYDEEEVDASISALTSIIEPIMMIGVGMMVGVIIISMYLPMFKMLTLIK